MQNKSKKKTDKTILAFETVKPVKIHRLEFRSTVIDILVDSKYCPEWHSAANLIDTKIVKINEIVCNRITEINPKLLNKTSGIMIQVRGKDAVKVLPKE